MGLHDFTFYNLVNRNAATYGDGQAWTDDGDGTGFLFRPDQDRDGSTGLRTAENQVLKKATVSVFWEKTAFPIFSSTARRLPWVPLCLPVNWRLSAEEVAYNLNDCGPKILFADPEFEKVIESLQTQTLVGGGLFQLSASPSGSFQTVPGTSGSG